MKTSTNSTHANAFARITKLHNIKAHEAKRNDQSAYDAMCEMMQVDACLFAAPQGFATWTTETQMRKVETHDEFYLNVTNEPYMRLVIEVTSEGYVSVAHYYRQNGDAMRDPEVVFDPANWRAVEYTQDSLGIYQRIKPGYYSPGIETFAGIWARNIKAQGFCEVMPAVPAVS